MLTVGAAEQPMHSVRVQWVRNNRKDVKILEGAVSGAQFSPQSSHSQYGQYRGTSYARIRINILWVEIFDRRAHNQAFTEITGH